MLDRPVIVAYLLIIVIMFIVINLVVDILYSVLDPRVRLADATGMTMATVVGQRPCRTAGDAAGRDAVPALRRRFRRRAGWRCSASSLFVLIIVIGAGWRRVIAPQNPYDLAQLDIMDGRCRRAARRCDGL